MKWLQSSMMDMNRIEIVIAEFAKKYNFLQWKDIVNVVTKSKPMFTKKQLQMDGKSFVEIKEYCEKNKDTQYVLFIGKICFNLESSSKKEDIYSVDTDGDCFSINLSEFSDEQTLIDTMIEKCKEYNHL
jgi:hypothetical protein